MGKNLKGKELGSGIYQRSDGKYCGRYHDRFGKRRYIYGRTLAETKEKLNTAIYEDKMRLNVIDNSVTLDEWYLKWMNLFKHKLIKPSTQALYVSIYKKHIQPEFGRMKLNDIQTLQIKGKLVELDKSGFGYETQNKVRVLLLDMFNKAVFDDIAVRNPVRGIKIARNDEKEPRVLTPEEQVLFFDTCKGTFYDNLFTVAVSTGLRPGELFALEPDDLDFDKMVIHVNKTLSYQKFEGDECKTFHFGSTKTKASNRDVPINKRCEIALKKQLLQKKVIASRSSSKPLPGFDKLIFTTRYNTPLNSQIYCDAIKTIVAEINLTRDDLEQFEPFSGHCFRHTFATRCFESSIQPKTVQKYLGHATLQMTMDLYTHVLENHLTDEWKNSKPDLKKLS